MAARHILGLLVALSTTSCLIYGRGRGQQARVERAFAKVDRPTEPRHMRYRVVGLHAGDWTYDVIVTDDRYAERRLRDDGSQYVVGIDGQGAWLQVGRRPAVVVTGAWADATRSSAAMAGLRFAAPAKGDHRELVGRYTSGWELAYRPEDGESVNLQLDPGRGLPFAVDRHDVWARITTCERLDWRRSFDGVVLDSARCGTSNGGDREHARTYRERRDLIFDNPLGTVPDWAQPEERLRRPRVTLPTSLPIAKPDRIHVPVAIGDGPPRDLLLDTGAFHTVISEDVARISSVLPTGEAPVRVGAPWIGDSEDWVGVADRLKIGNLVVHGARVLVSPRLGGEDGLVGRDIMREALLEVDSARGRVRFWEPDRFDLGAMKRLPLHRARTRVAVNDVVTGEMMLDTGMPQTLVVHHYAMAIKHPRRRGSAAFLKAGDSLKSPDYFTEIDGLSIGPFSLPRMPAIGRDRERDELGGGVGIMGMGVMRYFRLAFDYRGGWLGIEPADAYHVLHRLGVDIEDGAFGPTIDRVLRWSPGDEARLRQGDVILAIDGVRLDDLRAIRRRLADHPGPFVRLLLSRRGLLRRRTVALAARRR